MKKKLNVILTLFLVFVVQLTFAQEKTVTGTVSDNQGLPLPGVNVIVKGTNNGTQTDFDGNFQISTATGQVIVFSYVGFATQSQTVGASNTINVTLDVDAAALDEVIVLGYSTKGVEEVTGSSVQLGGEEIAKSPAVSVEQALQGKVAGLQISQSSGTPGSIQDIRIRGISSINGANDPLYVIDGVPVSNNNISGSANYSSLNPLASINSQDIASITVLKDASATAAYGARGSNGVIVVTTKSGASGDTSFTFSSQVGFQNDAYNKRDVLTGPQRYELLGEALLRSYGPNGTVRDLGVTTPAEARGLIPSIDANYDGTSVYDWAGEIRNEDALTQNYTFSASGGGEKSSFYASLGYNNTEATVIGSDFERINGSLNFDRDLRSNLKLSQSINVSNITQNPVLENGTFFSNPFITRVLMNPFNNIRNDDGTYNIDLPFGSLPNIFYVNENNVTRNALTRAITNTKLDWELFDGLTFSNRLGLDYQLNEYNNYNNRYEGDGAEVNGTIAVSDEKNFNLVYQGSLNYGFKLGEDHNFDFTALFEYQKNQNSYLFGSGENFPVDGLIQINTASANFDADSQFSDWYNVSYLGLINYNYAGKYVVDGTIRREGSSRFAPGNRFGTFGSVGAAWNIHREDFMSNSVFNTLRLRTSYGITGNNGVGLNAYQPLLTYSANYADNGAGFPSQFGNADLTWEKGESFDLGVSFGLLQNRVSGSFAYYNRRTYDLLLDVPLSLTTGFDVQARNVGEMVNKGIEAELAVDVIKTEDFTWNVSANYATVDNEVTELAVGADGNDLDTEAGSSYKTTRTGLPLRSWFMRTWAGVDTETGAPTWYVNGRDGEVTSNYNAAQRVDQNASALPTYSGGLGMRFDYRGFFAEGNAYFAGGHKIYEQYAQFYLRTNSFTLGTYNGAAELLERWQQPGDVTDVPKVDYGTNDNFHNTSSRHLYDGDYVRLKNVAVGYSLPSRFVETIGLDGLTLTLRGTNVATWVKDDGLKLDPEVRANGYTALTTPPVESYTLGVNIKF
ncbi:TonB-linked outer membrane protein, SusC/RagA family [Gillisia sp. Hel1_33_143]|uniref:SusC/RagA family TonB-linked outer membrane protein n=1 Tax=Gillisia sp. Hel1_33_143 TaxID=1336796 RepID=UPI00087ABD4C|nr:TonB-dependent receptor [Gillisia sp. Hel1_33_143]SDS03692.1 TonB-linked outer membrane protein, SusC/RagA family [Gillisia sp. Hel1_33_143]